MNGKRTHSDACVNGPKVIDEDIVITRCLPCSHQHAGWCQLTGKVITWAISGPIHLDCPLPRVPEDAA